ncbi:hypothetical protein GF312_09455 [Candidatus Poribacteria bacterium]|nr:hypothetical protein [Candidatus Poribacteria bacterium]
MKLFLYTFFFILLCAFITSCAEDIPEPLTHSEILGLLGEKTSNGSNGNGNNGTTPIDDIPITGDNYIAYIIESDDFPQMYIIGGDGEDKTAVTADWTMSGYAPFWTTNGKIAYYTLMNLGFSVINLDGTIDYSINTQQYGIVYEPYASWSRNNVVAISISDAQFTSSDIYSINSDGTNFIQLTASPVGGYSSHPSWSPDGSQLVFSYEDYNAVSANIFIVDSSGLTVTQLTFEGEEYEPDWSPKGDKIAFVSYRDGNSEIYIMNVDGTNQTNLTNTSWAYESNPDWSPDGNMIAYQSDANDNEDIYIMKANGSGQTNLTNNPSADDIDPSWGP